MRADVRDNWPVVSRLLDESLELDAKARHAWLESLPAEHAELRPILERLLQRHAEAAQMLITAPPLGTLPGVTAGKGAASKDIDPGQVPAIGTQVGSYRLRSLIGRGGMATVWLAESLVTNGARVPLAIKLPFMDGQSAQVIGERFERERQILAALNHPNIARLYEAGMSSEGTPFLALEYVEGETLPDYCARRSLPVRNRLQLFLQVLKAVQYAHASLVIHRDLKPSNIIVTTTGEVKLLDFGIAKLLDPETRHTSETRLTQLYGKLMTLDYASPEQVLGEPLGTASDVYSLGVVLYELLCGIRPYRLRRGSRAELEEAILTSDTIRPSQAFDSQFAAGFAGSPQGLRRILRGDLDTIVLKALDKDRPKRYPTAEAFAQDCERYLQRRPVLAQPQSRGYRLRKFVLRNRLVLAAGTSVAFALIVGLGVALWQAQIARGQSRLANEEARKQQAVQSFLTSLFDRNTREQADAARARSMTVRELLLDASRRVEHSFQDTPGVKLELLNTVARLLRDIDEYEQAASLSDQAVALAESGGLTKSDAYVEALIGQTATARLLGRGKQAVASRDKALALLDSRGDQVSLLRARAWANTVAQFAADPKRELQLVANGVRLFEQRYPDNPAYFQSLFYLANLYRTSQQPGQAEGYFRRAIEVFDRLKMQDFTSLGASYAFAGECGVWQGRIHAALGDYARGLEILDRHAGPTLLVVRFQRAQYIQALTLAGRVDEAGQVEQALADSLPAGAASTIADFDAATYRALALVEGGDGASARQVLLPFNDTWLQFGQRFVPNGGKWVVTLAHAQALLAEDAPARSTLQRVADLPLFYGVRTEDTPEFAGEASMMEMLGGRPEAATRALEKARTTLDETPDHFSFAYARLSAIAAQVENAAGNHRGALDRAERSLTHLAKYAEKNGFPYVEARAQLARGEALLGLGRPADAMQSLEAAQAIVQELHAAHSPWRLSVAAARARAHAALGQLPQARAQLKAAGGVSGRNVALPPYFRAILAQSTQAVTQAGT